jgi:hypothetical protein
MYVAPPLNRVCYVVHTRIILPGKLHMLKEYHQSPMSQTSAH